MLGRSIRVGAIATAPYADGVSHDAVIPGDRPRDLGAPSVLNDVVGKGNVWDWKLELPARALCQFNRLCLHSHATHHERRDQGGQQESRGQQSKVFFHATS